MVRETGVSQTNRHMNPLSTLLKCRVWAAGLEWGSRFSLSNKSPGDTDVAESRTTVLNITALDLANSREEMGGRHLRLDLLPFFAVLHQHQFCCCSVAQSCPTLCKPVDCGTPGSPVLHHLPELDQTHVHWVGDAAQPSHPLSSPSPPAFDLSTPVLPMSKLKFRKEVLVLDQLPEILQKGPAFLHLEAAHQEVSSGAMRWCEFLVPRAGHGPSLWDRTGLMVLARGSLSPRGWDCPV